MKQTRGKHYHRGKRKKRSSLLTTIILAVAVIVFCVSAFQLFRIGKGYYDGRSEYDEIRSLAVENAEKAEEFRVNFDELLNRNPDTVGWLRFYPEPAVISYPLVQGPDNELYLTKTFSANDNNLGAIFLNVSNSANFIDRNSVIYGHRMKDGSMFRALEEYKDQGFYESNPYFYIYTKDGRKLTYHIYSVGEVEADSETYQTFFASDEVYQFFLNMTKENAMYDTGLTPTVEDTLVTLSTCTKASDEHRLVVRGMKVKEEVVGNDD